MQIDNVGSVETLSPNNKYVFVLGSSSPGPTPGADIPVRFRSDGIRNGSFIKDPKLDALIDKQQSSLVTAERKAALTELQTYFHDNFYQWSIGNPTLIIAASYLKDVEGLNQSEYEAWTRVYSEKA